jgi:molybdate transport system substrate-binding protein
VIRLLATFLGAALVLANCGGRPGGGSPLSAFADVALYAAASLTTPLESVMVRYVSSHPGIRLTPALDSSAALRTQIEQGAPADVFLSADLANPQNLVDAGLAVGPVTWFARNRLAIVVPKANPGTIATPADLGAPGVRIVAAGEQVPISAYSGKLIGQLAALPGYPPDFASAYEANVVSREDNVRAIVAKLELGEADAGIVYVTDALGSDELATVALPPEAAVSATYGGVIVSASARSAEGAAFLSWLAGLEGQAILADFGFVAPE